MAGSAVAVGLATQRFDEAWLLLLGRASVSRCWLR